MSRTFEIGTNPVDADHKIYKRRLHTIETGVTVLVGCNGSGKTTLLNEIKYQLKDNKIPVFLYNNLHDGGGHARQNFLNSGNISALAFSTLASEGENISQNIGYTAAKLGKFMRDGKVKRSRLEETMTEIIGGKEEGIQCNERWILFDAVDSGYSIDNVIELKEDLFNFMLDDAKSIGVDLYIVVSANEYEMCAGEKCYDVQSCKYVDIRSYEEYKKLILETRKWKDKSIKRGH